MGRDILAGTMVGVIVAILEALQYALPYWTDIRGIIPAWLIPSEALGDARQFMGVFASSLQWGVTLGLFDLALLFLVRVIVRKDWLAIGVTAVALTAAGLEPHNIVVTLPITALQIAFLLFVLTRFGLLALMISWFLCFLLAFTPMTTSQSSLYAGRSLFVLLVVTALAVCGFRLALFRRPALGNLAADDL